MSIENLASRSGVDSKIISELESSTRRPEAATQMDLADALGVRLWRFYEEDLFE